MLSELREQEIKKYRECYRSPAYKMGDKRKHHIIKTLELVEKGSLLDVGCGRGESLKIAENMGFTNVHGVEAVRYLCDGDRIVNAMAHELPFDDKAFDVVTMFDVIEHLVPHETDSVCKELERVASKNVLISVHNGPSKFNGIDLHINRKGSYDEWFDYFKETFSGKVEWLPRHNSISEMFKVTYGFR